MKEMYMFEVTMSDAMVGTLHRVLTFYLETSSADLHHEKEWEALETFNNELCDAIRMTKEVYDGHEC